MLVLLNIRERGAGASYSIQTDSYMLKSPLTRDPPTTYSVDRGRRLMTKGVKEERILKVMEDSDSQEGLKRLKSFMSSS